MRRLIAACAAAAAAAASAAAAAAPAGLYGISANNTLVRIGAGGNVTACGPPLAAELVPGEGLSAIDEAAATLFAVLFNVTAQAPFLVGIALANGAVTSSVRLPFVEGGIIALGQVLALNTVATPTVAIVGGQNAAGDNVLATVSAVAGGDYKQFAAFNSSFTIIDSGSSAYIPATHALLLSLNYETSGGACQTGIFSVDVATGAATVLVESYDSGNDIQTLSGYDAVTGNVFGLGIAGAGASLQRQVVALDPVALSIAAVGNVTVDTILDSGISAFDSQRRSLFWIGDRGGTDVFQLNQHSVDAGAELLSRAPLCAYGDCPYSLEYYAGGAVAAH